MSGNEIVPRIGLEILDGQRHPPILGIDAGNYRVDLLPLLQNFSGMLDSTRPGNIRNVDQTVDAVFDFDERAKIRHIADPPMDAPPNLVPPAPLAPVLSSSLLPPPPHP